MKHRLLPAVSLAAFATIVSTPAYAQQPSGRAVSQTQEFNMLGVTLGDAPEHVRSTLTGRGYRLVSDSRTGTRATPRMQVFSLSEGWRADDRIEMLYHRTTDSYAVGFMRRVIDVNSNGGPFRRTYHTALAKLYGQPALPVLGEKNKADALFYRSADSPANCFGFPMGELSPRNPPTLLPRSSVAGQVCQKGMAIELIYEPHGNQRIQQVVQFVYDTRNGDAGRGGQLASRSSGTVQNTAGTGAGWKATPSRDGSGATVDVLARSGTIRIIGSCSDHKYKANIPRVLPLDVYGYSGGGRRYVDDDEEEFTWEVQDSTGNVQGFPIRMYYYEPDRTWMTVSDQALPADFVEAVETGSAVTLRNHSTGTTVAAFDMNGATEAMQVVKQNCEPWKSGAIAHDDQSGGTPPGAGYNAFRLSDADRRRLVGIELERCLNNAVSTADMVGCNSAASQRLDPVLAQAYQRALTTSPANAGQLRASQTAWTSSYDDRCYDAAVAEFSNGSAAGISHSGCIVDEKARRIAWLLQSP